MLRRSWSYRTAAPPASKATLYTAEAVSAGMWWWVLWHLWHEYEHITVRDALHIILLKPSTILNNFIILGDLGRI